MMIQEPAIPTQNRPGTDRHVASFLPISLNRVAAALQVVLATRRVARCDEHGYWYSIARGM